MILGVDEPYRFHYLALGGNLEQELRLINDDGNVVSTCKLHLEWPIDTIILYVGSGYTTLAVVLPEGLVEGLVMRKMEMANWRVMVIVW